MPSGHHSPDRGETIVALASGGGRAGVAVVRLSGPASLETAQRLFHVKQSPALAPRHATLRPLYAPGNGAFLDEALVIVMPGPNSFTGEDVVELQIHGGAANVEAMLRACVETGLCRVAGPGEFTRRAFENGRLDLTQAEGLADLIDAETEGQRAQALRLLQGEAGNRFEAWRERLIEAMAALEAAIDFPDESDVPEQIARRSLEPLERLQAEIEAALSDWARNRSVREGFRIAILGKPNAGKSSLLNQLAGREAAIVSPIAGTTRDVVEVRMVLGGFTVWVADTAGLREAVDQIEAEGVRRALDRAQSADLRIWLLDATDEAETPERVSRETSFAGGDLVVWNKTDLAAGRMTDDATFAISAETGDGIPALLSALEQEVVRKLSSSEAPIVTRARHQSLTTQALDHLRSARRAFQDGLGPELVGEDVRMAARALGQVTGKVDVEDLLDRIFSDFCIGK